jgi:aarF domain-containing kinase
MRIHHPQATIGIVVVVVVVVVTSATFASAFRAPIEINNRLLLPKEVDRRRDDTALFSTRERRPPAAVSELSRQMAEMRTQIASENEDANLIMQALRGRNINDDDEQVRGLEMKLIEFDDVDGVGDAASGLPYEYDPIALQKFFAKRPQLAVARVVQVLTTGGGVLFNFAVDYLTGRLKTDPDWEVKRAGELRDTITSLGPFFIKLGQVRDIVGLYVDCTLLLGLLCARWIAILTTPSSCVHRPLSIFSRRQHQQALSIRPDILSPRSMVELQKLCDKVPSFDSKIAYATMERELGRPVDEVFSFITPEPVAAASLGQVVRS